MKPASKKAPRFDVLVIGAGAAGLLCAALAGQGGRRVLLLDHAAKLGEKIRISGGGRCNFTNRGAGPQHYFSENPQFCRQALSRYTPADFIRLLGQHRIRWHEKHKGQLFCDDSAEDVIAMLLRECEAGRVERWQPCQVLAVEAQGDDPAGAGPEAATRANAEADADTSGTAAIEPSPPTREAAAPQGFVCHTDRGPVEAARLVIATGGLSIPKIGASDFGLRLARQFGHRIVPTRAALVPLTFDPVSWAPYAALSGLSLPVAISTGEGAAAARFEEDLLFTHRGLSGPAVLQISTPWQPGTDIVIDLAPALDLEALLFDAKQGSRRQLATELSRVLPARLAATWLAARKQPLPRFMAEIADRDLRELARSLHAWRLRPAGSEGYRKAEVTAGGVDTRQLDPRSMESRLCPGLHFIGEVVDVTGWLGGYNFQWAWASAAACAQALCAATDRARASGFRAAAAKATL